MAQHGHDDDFWRARTPGTPPGGGARPPGRREPGGLPAAAGLPPTAGLTGAKPPIAERADPRGPGRGGGRGVLLGGLATLLVVAVALGIGSAVLLLRDDDPDPAGRGAPLTQAAPAPAEVTFTDDECGTWSPEDPDDVNGWLYRSCLRRDTDEDRGWIAGVQVHNVGTDPADLRVYLSYLSVGPGGRSPITLRKSDADFTQVEPDGVETRAVALYRHPGGVACVWLEAAPLFLAGQQWSASPGVTVNSKACNRPKVNTSRS